MKTSKKEVELWAKVVIDPIETKPKVKLRR